MVLELHVWGPAFGLPSIDPECLAVIAYFNWKIPQPNWHIIADYDPSASPQHEFPLLVDGYRKVTGFSRIISYLQKLDSGRWYSDGHLTQEQVTNGTAFASFLESTAGPLADLSLYISSENYNSITSSAYTAILPWYLNYTIPPRRREVARSRTAHLGLSNLELSAESSSNVGRGTLSSEFENAKRDAGMPTQLPALDIGRKSGLQGLLGSSVYAARFRLDALTNDLLEPFEHILTKKQYLLEPDQPSCLDFLAFGYLALMLYPQVPQAWLQEAMRARFPRVVDYVEHMRRRSITEQHTKPSDVWAISYGREEASKLGLHLPWRPIPPRPLSSTVSKIAQEVTSNLPILSMMYKQEPIVRADTPRVSRKVATRLPSQTTINALTSVTAAAAAGVVAMAIHHRRNPREGNLIFWALRPQAQGFGEAGNILSALTGELAMGM